MSGWMWIWPVLIIAGLLIIGYAVFRIARGGVIKPATSSTARRVLDERFARGEIDEAEYCRRRELLT